MGNTTTYVYTPLGWPKQQQVATSDPELGPTYDKAGQVISDTDLQNGAVTTYSYDFFGDQFEPGRPTSTSRPTRSRWPPFPTTTARSAMPSTA